MLDRALPSGTMVFRFFKDTPVERRVTARVRRVVWASMRNTDVGVFELDTTVGFLRRRGIVPLVVGEEVEEELVVRGIPVARVFPDEQFLRAASCRFEGAYDLIEFVWTFRRFLRDDCADISGGSSGSPVMNRRSGEVVSVMSTTVEGEAPCYLGMPCVVGGEVVPGNYSAPVLGLGACFRGDGWFEPRITGCPLPVLGPPVLSGGAGRVVREGREWGVTVNGRYRYGVIEERVGFCESAVYGEWRRASE